MKYRYYLFACLIMILIVGLSAAYSKYGAPTEFGNETTTTCWIGGDEGIINCTGNATVQNIFANLSWNYLKNYPIACSEGYAVTQLEDSVVCTAFVQEDTNTTFQNVNATHFQLNCIGESPCDTTTRGSDCCNDTGRYLVG